MKRIEITIACRRLHPETAYNEYVWRPGCPCNLCQGDTSSYKMYLANTQQRREDATGGGTGGVAGGGGLVTGLLPNAANVRH